MTKLKGVIISGLSYTGINLADIPGAYFWMKVGDNMQFRSGNNIESVRSKIVSPSITLQEDNAANAHRLVYGGGIPYITPPLSNVLLDDVNNTNFKFLHYQDSYSVFHVFNPDPIPAGTGSANVRYIFGTKNTLSTNPGIAVRLENSPTNGLGIRVSRTQTLELLAPNSFSFGANNLLEFRFTKTGSTNNLKLFTNNMLVGETTNTVADNSSDQQSPFALSNSVTTSRFLGRYGDLFIVKNTGKPDAQVVEESAIINQYFAKYF